MTETTIIEVTAPEYIEIIGEPATVVEVGDNSAIVEVSPPETIEVHPNDYLIEVFPYGQAPDLVPTVIEPPAISLIFESEEVPPAPANLSVTGALFYNELTWESATYTGHWYTEIWRSPVNNISTAGRAGVSIHSPMKDPVEPNILYYYWVRFVSLSGVTGPWSTASGTASTIELELDPLDYDIEGLIALLKNAFDESALTIALRTRLNSIEGLMSDLAVEITNRENAIVEAKQLLQEYTDAAVSYEASLREGAIVSAEADMNDAFAATWSWLDTRITDTETGVSGNASALNLVTTRVTNNEGDISSQASAIVQLDTTVDTHTTKIQQQLTSINGLEAQYTVKIDNNNYVSGFGLASTPSVDGTPFSEFTVIADRFAIAPVASSPTTGSPFFHLTVPTVINGVLLPAGTYIQSAFIHDASITNAKIQNAAVDTLTIAGNAVTTPAYANGIYSASVSISITQAGWVMAFCTFTQGVGKPSHRWTLLIGGMPVQNEIPIAGTTGALSGARYLSAGTHTVQVLCETETGDGRCGIVAMGAMR